MTKKNSCWGYNGDCLKRQPEGFTGFIYLITNLKDGRIYIGKKQFLTYRKKRISKKARIARKTRKRTEIERVDTQWLNYWSSSKELQEDVASLGELSFEREVLRLCKSKAEMTYYEGHYQYAYNVMFKPSYNKWIFIRVRKVNLQSNANKITNRG